ncbi:hypothetical protein DE146DRAFT_341519 [Phaeosphaeria sp. MPI-PUGE-AT-0046c]|nr:hypothetical protein DE146DRAFT_341519 [Phaeosphaeria sp. MPI-PUGE-AT-0046c]
MPSFAFWKASKADGKVDETTDSAPVDNGDKAQSPAMMQPIPSPKIDLDVGSQDSGVFTFEDMERLAQCAPTTPLQKFKDYVRPSAALSSIGQVDDDAALLDDEHIQSRCATPESSTEHDIAAAVEIINHSKQVKEINLASTRPKPSPSIQEGDEVHALSSAEKSLPSSKPAPSPPLQNFSQREPSNEKVSAPSRPAPSPLKEDISRSPSLPTRVSSLTPSIAHQPDGTSRRLHRPTELNLGSVTCGSSRPLSELEKQFSLVRNSRTQSKAALRSPTELLNQRLGGALSTKNRESKVHVFVPPSPPRDGCLLPGPAGQVDAFTSTSVRARTAGGRPAWWCKVDKLVVFDGMEAQKDGSAKTLTRTSKGLSIARRRGDTETVVIPMDCAHCQEMLNRHEWKYDIQVCKRSVCWDCKERCSWELEQELKESMESNVAAKEGNRDRADSVLQDDDAGEEHLMRKMGLEEWRSKSPIEAVGGIEERIEGVGGR